MPSSGTAFGVGDYGGYNNFAFSGANFMWTNWYGSPVAIPFLGRVTALAARWDAYCPNNSGTSGHNGMYNQNSPFAQLLATGGFSVGCASGSGCTMHNVATADYWTDTTSVYLGFSRTAADSCVFGFQNGFGGGYTGKSGGDSDISGGTAAWGGTNGGLPTYGTQIGTLIYVRRGGVWIACLTWTWRSGAYRLTVTFVRRSGAFVTVNRMPFHLYMQRSERHVPARGMAVTVDVGQGPEPGWLVEGGLEWFGSVDPTAMGFDWRKLGHHAVREPVYTGRFSSADPLELVDRRLAAYDLAQRALKAGNAEEAETWLNLTKLGREGALTRTPTGRLWTPTAFRPLFRPSPSPSRGGRPRPSTISSVKGVPATSARTPAFSSGTRTRTLTLPTTAAPAAAKGLPSAPSDADCGCP